MSMIDRAFSIHDDAMMLRSRRSSILAANIANADTPDYKARDLDFDAMMQQLDSPATRSVTLARTHQRHLNPATGPGVDMVKYRNPLQPALDGNTVDMHAEQARFAQNAFQYQTSLTLVGKKISGLLLAIKGQ